MHGVQGGLVALRVDLDMLDPDVLPEAQAHHIQVITTITEDTRQLHEHCDTSWQIHYFTVIAYVTT